MFDHELSTLRWRKSSYSDGNGGSCVEVADLPIFAAWRKSSYSDGNNGHCVEVADGLTEIVPVRDSKRPEGPALAVPAASWTAFIDGLKADHFG